VETSLHFLGLTSSVAVISLPTSRTHLSYETVRTAARCEIQEEQGNTFKRELLAAYKSYHSCSIFNGDENCHLVLWQAKMAVAETRSQSITIRLDGTQKPK
jgi:hypothetical protein